LNIGMYLEYLEIYLGKYIEYLEYLEIYLGMYLEYWDVP